MILKTATETIDFRSLGYVMRTSAYDQTPSKNNSKVSVIGRDGEIVFENGLKNKAIKVILSAIDAASIWERRSNARAITKAILDGGQLTLDYEPDIYWIARVLNKTGVSFSAGYDELTIEFDLDPLGYNNLTDENLTWEEAATYWETTDLPWTGYTGDDFTIDGSDITVENTGNYPALPTIRLVGSGTVTMTHSDGTTFTVTGLSGTIYIDSENQIVYDDSNINKIGLYTGDFIELQPGDNVISTSGSATAEFINKDRVMV